MIHLERSLPTAVLVGAAMISLVLWRGLEKISVVVDSVGRRTVALVDEPVHDHEIGRGTRGTSPQVASDSAVAAVDAKVRLDEQLLDALTAQKPAYVKACWQPKAPAQGKVPDLGGVFEVDVTFGLDGVEVAREIRGVDPNSELLKCIQKQSLAKIRVPPLGSRTVVKVSLGIP